MTIAQRLLTPFYYGVKPAYSSSHENYRHPLLDKPKILACSVITSQQRLLEFQDLDRKLCEDRKTPLEHLYLSSLTKSTIRIVVTQGSFVLSSYANDQLQQDLARDKLVSQGKLSQEEADNEAEEWETREWKARWESFPSKLTEALVKYHAIVLVMRLYEHVAAKIVDKITLDSLTLDTFKYAKRLDAKEESRVEVGRQMWGVTLKANLISFLADYSVHQLILAYGYYAFIRERRRRKRIKDQSIGKVGSAVDSKPDEQNDEQKYPIIKQSATLVMSRGLGLVFTACGGALGSMSYPGWGTLFGSNLGDSLGAIVSEGVIP